MSFHLTFTAANREDALAIVKQTPMPASVTEFIASALAGVPDDQPVSIKASGHLDNGAYASNADISVTPLKFDKPRG